MSFFSIFENLKLTGKFWKRVAPYISIYLLAFVFSLLGVWIAYVVNKNLMAGFTLFSFFPGWLRFFCFDLIASALIGIPVGIFLGFPIPALDYHSIGNYILKLVDEKYYIEYLMDNLKIKCIDCFTEIYLDGGVCVSGQTDVRCKECNALMTITTEEGQLKKLILKEHRKYHY